LALRRADHSSKESYRLCKKDYEIEEEARAQQVTVEPLMKEMNDIYYTTVVFNIKKRESNKYRLSYDYAISSFNYFLLLS
jgi:hypothetical protein